MAGIVPDPPIRQRVLSGTHFMEFSMQFHTYSNGSWFMVGLIFHGALDAVPYLLQCVHGLWFMAGLIMFHDRFHL